MPRPVREKIYNPLLHIFLNMFDSSKTSTVEDTEENRAICRKYCPICPNYRHHQLGKYQPTELFCAHGRSSAQNMKQITCFCSGCELYLQHHQRVGYFCVQK